jgi:hypothetical protein
MADQLGSPSQGTQDKHVQEFDADAVARQVAEQTEEMMRVLEGSRDPQGVSEETLRTTICV